MAFCNRNQSNENMEKSLIEIKITVWAYVSNSNYGEFDLRQKVL
jgi:hypothetical protein